MNGNARNAKLLTLLIFMIKKLLFVRIAEEKTLQLHLWLMKSDLVNKNKYLERLRMILDKDIIPQL